ncbi:MAG: deoxyguanosinetriphosphate triphosphohydrolase [Bdellovibrionota bacterium]
MLIREKTEKIERATLAPYACFSDSSWGRVHPEEKSDSRTDFQRDRDRIIHSTAFRRLEYKTQVFVNHEGDHYRTRLTHSLEVAQIGRSVARAMSLNEDLIEALILVHDQGHTPFGHAGERVMSMLMKDHGGFEHNLQSLRVVEQLEHPYPDFPGLNLTFEVREGIVKHSAHWKKERVPQELKPHEFPGLEAQLIDIVDEIAYNNHDLDDGLSSKMITMDELEDVTLWKKAFSIASKKFPNASRESLKRPTISAMITLLINDLIQETSHRLKKHNIQSMQELRNLKEGVTSYSEEIGVMNIQLKKFLRENMYTHPRVIRMEEKAKRILIGLFQAYRDRPTQMPKDFLERNQHQSIERIICDYIAGMTDRFAIDEYQKLFDPNTRV